MYPEHSARISAHRNNIARYRRILGSGLTPLERAYVERRISEENIKLEALMQQDPRDKRP